MIRQSTDENEYPKGMSDTFDHEGDAFDAMMAGQEDDRSGAWPYERTKVTTIRDHTDTHPCPSRHGELWTMTERRQLTTMFDNLMDVPAMAKQLGRSDYAIRCQLETLSLNIKLRDQARQIVPSKHHEIQTATAKKERHYVNMNHLITMLQKGYTTCEVSFSQANEPTTYTYKVSDKAGLVAGDQVVVYGKNNMQIAFVKEVHATPQIDVKSPYALKWIVCKVDRVAYDDQVRRETEAVKLMEDAERLKTQQEALDTLLGTVNKEQLMLLINGPEA